MWQRFLDWIGYQCLLHLPIRIGGNPNTRFGVWCLRRAGSHAYSEEITR